MTEVIGMNPSHSALDSYRVLNKSLALEIRDLMKFWI
jgi:hypothetical protein